MLPAFFRLSSSFFCLRGICQKFNSIKKNRGDNMLVDGVIVNDVFNFIISFSFDLIKACEDQSYYDHFVIKNV